MRSGVDPAEWQRLLDRANAGELFLDPEVGKGLDKVCDDHLDRLRDILRWSGQMRDISGFGTFNSGQILQNKFRDTATGKERSLDAVLKQHIDGVMATKEVVAKAISNFVTQDQERASQIEQVTPE